MPVRFQPALEPFLLGHRRIRLREPAIRHFASIKAIPTTRVPPFLKSGVRVPSTGALRRPRKVFFTKYRHTAYLQRSGDFDLDSPNSCFRHDKHVWEATIPWTKRYMQLKAGRKRSGHERESADSAGHTSTLGRDHAVRVAGKHHRSETSRSIRHFTIDPRRFWPFIRWRTNIHGIQIR